MKFEAWKLLEHAVIATRRGGIWKGQRLNSETLPPFLRKQRQRNVPVSVFDNLNRLLVRQTFQAVAVDSQYLVTALEAALDRRGPLVEDGLDVDWQVAVSAAVAANDGEP